MKIEKVKTKEPECITCGMETELHAVKNSISEETLFYICKDGMRELVRDFEAFLKNNENN